MSIAPMKKLSCAHLKLKENTQAGNPVRYREWAFRKFNNFNVNSHHETYSRIPFWVKSKSNTICNIALFYKRVLKYIIMKFITNIEWRLIIYGQECCRTKPRGFIIIFNSGKNPEKSWPYWPSDGIIMCISTHWTTAGKIMQNDDGNWQWFLLPLSLK